MKQYLKEMNKKFGYRATWEPSKPLHIGDVGILEKGIFTLLSNVDKELEDVGVKIQVREDPQKGELSYNSEGSVEVTTKLAGKATTPGSQLAEGEAGFTVHFKKDKAIVFQANETTTQQIENFGEVSREIIKKYMRNEWPRNWIVITELVSAKEGTILISNTRNSTIDIKATGDASPTAGLNIADVNLGLKIVSEKGLQTEIVAKSGLTPLYRASGIKKGFFGGNVSVGSKGETDGFELSELPFEDSEVD